MTDHTENIARRIAEYLRLNGFANLNDAAAKGWGDISPLKDPQKKGPSEEGPKNSYH